MVCYLHGEDHAADMATKPVEALKKAPLFENPNWCSVSMPYSNRLLKHAGIANHTHVLKLLWLYLHWLGTGLLEASEDAASAWRAAGSSWGGMDASRTFFLETEDFLLRPNLTCWCCRGDGTETLVPVWDSRETIIFLILDVIYVSLWHITTDNALTKQNFSTFLLIPQIYFSAFHTSDLSNESATLAVLSFTCCINIMCIMYFIMKQKKVLFYRQ